MRKVFEIVYQVYLELKRLVIRNLLKKNQRNFLLVSQENEEHLNIFELASQREEKQRQLLCSGHGSAVLMDQSQMSEWLFQ